MRAIDPRVDPALVPPGAKPVVIAENQPEYSNLPAIVTPGKRVITRWEPTPEERAAIARGEDIFLTIWGTPINPVHLAIGLQDWTNVDRC